MQVDPEVVEKNLSRHGDVTHVAFVHCETTTGILNPLPELARVVKAHGKKLIVDAMSSFRRRAFWMCRNSASISSSAVRTNVSRAYPVFGFIIARRSELMACKGVSRSLSLDIYDQWETMEKGHGKWRFTSPTHVVRAFKEAMEELKAEGGVAARYARYCKNHEVLVKGMESLGFKALLPAAVQSPVITSFLYPEKDFDFKAFYAELKAKGFVIYPGKISQADTFRIGNIGDVYPEDFERLVETVKACCEA